MNLNAQPPSEDRPDLLTPFDVENFVGAIEPSKLLDLGAIGWLEKHQRTQQLAIQSVIQALSNREETVKDQLVSLEKLSTLIQDLITTEFWRENVFPIMLKEGGEKIGIFVYPILYHETSIVNLLETVLFHSEAVGVLEEASLDLSDYCVRTLTQFLAGIGDLEEEEPDEEQKKKRKTEDQGFKAQTDPLLVGISIKCLSILRYLVDNLDQLGHGITSRLVISSDTPMLLTELIVQKPWRKEWWKSGKVEEFDPTAGGWKEIDPSARMIISKTEAQAWLCLYLFFKRNEILSVYELYDSRKNSLMKLRPYLNEMTLDQLPFLAEFQAFLNQISVCSGPFGPSKSPLLLEMVPPFRADLDEMWTKERRNIVQHFREELLGGDKSAMIEKAKALASVYDMDAFAAALPILQNCASCGKMAEKKCSRCKEVWYCGKDCQVADWKNHRDHCHITN